MRCITKFLCDQMLIRLGRWLRAAGYDTVIIEKSLPDSALLLQAQQEQRILLTRDKLFSEMKADPGRIVWLKSNSVKDCAQELSEKLSINWLLAPFTRCLLCNSVLEGADESVIKQTPPDIQIRGIPLLHCRQCNKTYWEGSHVKRMLRQLQSWNR